METDGSLPHSPTKVHDIKTDQTAVLIHMKLNKAEGFT
jgi:hypothetical protein